MKKKLSARDRYRQIVNRQTEADLNKPVDEKTPLFEFTAPSGMIFKVRRPDLKLFFNMGTMPMAFAANLKMDEEAAGQMFQSLSPQRQAALIEQSANIVRYMCVDPRIVDDPQADDEISPDDVTLADFNALVELGGSGGDEAKWLSNFRPK